MAQTLYSMFKNNLTFICSNENCLNKISIINDIETHTDSSLLINKSYNSTWRFNDSPSFFKSWANGTTPLPKILKLKNDTKNYQ